MIVYNVTVNVEDSIREDWVRWMKEEHIQAVLDTGLFVGYRFSRVMIEEESGTTFSVQYQATDMESFKLYEQLYAQKLRKDTMDRFGNKLVAFRTLLEIIDEKYPNQ